MQPSPHTFQYPKVTPLASAASPPKPSVAPSASETPGQPQR
jgi:hypothetical protein